MLLPTMTYLEMYECIKSDEQKLDYWKQKLHTKASKALYTNPWHYETVTINRNQYIIFYYKEPHYTFSTDFTSSYCILLNGRKRMAVQVMMNGIHNHYDNKHYSIPCVNLFSEHFFERYNERFLKNNNLKYNEIVGIFFSRNNQHIPVKIDERINLNIEKYSDFERMGFKVRDGFCFTAGGIQTLKEENTPVALGNIYTTFLDNETLDDSQIEAIKKEYLASLNLWKEFQVQ